eukprot:1417894-Pyramimonas_sp.AAC.1
MPCGPARCPEFALRRRRAGQLGQAVALVGARAGGQWTGGLSEMDALANAVGIALLHARWE